MSQTSGHANIAVVDAPSPEASEQQSRGRLSFALKLLVTLALVALVVTQLEWAALADRISRMHFGWCGVALALALCERFLQAVKWRVLVSARAAHVRLPVLGVFRIQLIANFFGSFLPSSVGVDAIRIMAVRKYDVSTIDAVASTLVDRALIVVGQLMLGAVMTLLLSTLLPPALRWFIWATAGGVFIVGTLLTIAPLMRRISRWLGPIARSSIGKKVGELYRAVHNYHRQPAALAKAGLLTLIAFGVRLGFAQALVWTMEVDLVFWQLAMVWPLTWLIAMVPITIGAIGLQEGAYIVLFGIFGVGPTAAVAVSLLEHLTTRLVTLPGGLAWLIQPKNGPRSATSNVGSP